jgi:hypothetical protein
MKFFRKDGKLRTKTLFIIGLMLAGIAAVITLSLFTVTATAGMRSSRNSRGTSAPWGWPAGPGKV